MTIPQRPEIFDLAVRQAAVRWLAPLCRSWHRIAYCEQGDRIKPRWDEEKWVDSLTKVLWRDTGRNIAVKLCAFHGLAGMNEDLTGILDQAVAMLEEETDKALREWVRTYAVTPKLAIGTRVANGRITDCDAIHAHYWLVYDDPPRKKPRSARRAGGMRNSGTAARTGGAAAHDRLSACGPPR